MVKDWQPASRHDPGPVIRPGVDPAAAPSPVMDAVGMATPLALTAALAAIMLFVEMPGSTTAWPLPMLLIAAMQASGVLLARELERPAWQRVWIMALLSTSVALPVFGILAASLRVPFVSLGWGSARSVVWLTFGALAVLLGLAIATALLAADTPEQASLLFVPVALLPPVVLGLPGTIGERSALVALVETSTVASLAVFVGSILPRGARPLVGPVALGAQFVVLWMQGYTPLFPVGQGRIVAVLASAVLVLTVVAMVVVPLGALVARQMVQAIVDEASRPPRPASGGAREQVEPGVAPKRSSRPRSNDH